MSTTDEDERVKFTIYSTSDTKDPKTTVTLIYSIEVLSGPIAGIYGFAPELRQLRSHEALCKLPVIAGIIRVMKTRGQIRRGLLKLPPEVRKLYFDENDNVKFNEIKEYLTSSPVLAVFDPNLPISIFIPMQAAKGSGQC